MEVQNCNNERHASEGGFVTTFRRAAKFGAGLVRAIAGAPAGVERSRRGSFLVLVVATLALMSVFAIIYVTVGKTDAGTKRGLQIGEKREDVPNQIADHIATIIGDDVFATLNLGVDGKGQPFNIRESSDIPGVNWAMVSDKSGPSETWFEPVGTYTSQWTGSGADPRTGSDPFLASSEPTYLGFGEPASKHPNFDEFRDWAAISNVAPDGAFVNLFNLRGNFNATPQVMRQNLSLFDANGVPTTALDFAGSAKSNVPAHWTNRQRGLFRPANTIINGTAIGPNDKNYLDYQYADTDGDGFYDARFFELVDARDQSNVKNLLKTDDGMRYFFAVRVEDLSSRADVLTAMDMKGPPASAAEAVGLVPEVDLRRILSLIDPLSDYPNDALVKLGYGGLQQPQNDTQKKSVENYTDYVPDLNGGMSMLVGEWAYHALHNTTGQRLGAIHTGVILPPQTLQTVGTPFFYANPDERTKLYEEQLGIGLGFARDTSVGAFTSIEDLAELLTYRGINDPSVTSQLEMLFGGAYRDKQQNRDPDRETVRFSPLRDNRSLALERDVDNIDQTSNLASTKPDGIADSDAMLWSWFDVRQRISPLIGCRPIMPTRVLSSMSSDQLTPADLRRPLSTDVTSLYSMYADALIPDSAMDNAWRSNSTAQFDAMRFSNYGYLSAEFGARTAAHLAVNAAAAFQGGSNALAFTVLLDESYRDTLYQDWANETTGDAKPMANRSNMWSWWVDHTSNTGALDIGVNWKDPAKNKDRDTSRLGDTNSGDKFESKAINVYGVTPQPVLTAAASFYVYADAPTSASPAEYGLSGDKEWDEVDDGSGNTIYVGKPITINGTVSETNGDFLMQVVAFQLTNPFNSTIYLTANGFSDGQPLLLQDRFEYYIEFAGRYFRLAQFNVDNPSANFTSAALGPGETRVYYAMCLPLESASGKDIVSRWKNAKSTITKDKVKAWIDTQMSVVLGTGTKVPTLIEEFDPTTGARTAPAGFVNLVEKAATTKSQDSTSASVRLWRALRTPVLKNGTITENPKDLQKDALPTPQYIENDQLVDRLRDPKAASGGSTFDQKLSLSGAHLAEIPGTEGGPDDGSAADKKDNTGFAITRFGVVKRNDDPSGTSAGTFDPRTDGVPAYMLEPKWTSAKLKNLEVTGPANSAINRGTFVGTEDGHGYEKVTDLINSEGLTPVLPYRQLTTEPRKWEKNHLTGNLSGKEYKEVRTEIVSGLKASTARVSDLLLPLAIGPEYDDAPAKFDDRYLTLGEALANAMDYSSPTGTNNPSKDPLYFRLGATPGKKALLNGTQFPKLDRGHLSLDKFVPFVDTNNNQILDRTIAGEFRRGAGVPLALTIFDRVEGIDSRLWGVDRPILGRINVNTAYRTVLRSVGVLTPTPSTVSNEWWWTNLDNKSDIATTILAYRDKLMYWPRESSPTTNGEGVDFRDIEKNTEYKPDDYKNLVGRLYSSGVDFIREQPGIESVGEVMLARALDPGQPVEGNTWHKNPNNIDFMGYNDAVDFKDGVSSGDELKVKDTYGERLQIASSAMNALSTRSDYFAVWFVIRGYRESDVMGLNANDPMVPSVQRRFVMVVDRSNVTKFGQKPRILFLKEVPF